MGHPYRLVAIFRVGRELRGQKAWTPRVDCDSMGLLLEGAFGHVPGVRGGGS